jgi:hypothetical protein
MIRRVTTKEVSMADELATITATIVCFEIDI